jgi:hypothetical protein
MAAPKSWSLSDTLRREKYELCHSSAMSHPFASPLGSWLGSAVLELKREPTKGHGEVGNELVNRVRCAAAVVLLLAVG